MRGLLPFQIIGNAKASFTDGETVTTGAIILTLDFTVQAFGTAVTLNGPVNRCV